MFAAASAGPQNRDVPLEKCGPAISAGGAPLYRFVWTAMIGSSLSLDRVIAGPLASTGWAPVCRRSRGASQFGAASGRAIAGRRREIASMVEERLDLKPLPQVNRNGSALDGPGSAMPGGARPNVPRRQRAARCGPRLDLAEPAPGVGSGDDGGILGAPTAAAP